MGKGKFGGATYVVTSSSSSSDWHHLSKGQIAALAIGGTMFFFTIVGCVVWLCWGRRLDKKIDSQIEKSRSRKLPGISTNSLELGNANVRSSAFGNFANCSRDPGR